jgi:hypothetical protein
MQVLTTHLTRPIGESLLFTLPAILKNLLSHPAKTAGLDNNELSLPRGNKNIHQFRLILAAVLGLWLPVKLPEIFPRR